LRFAKAERKYTTTLAAERGDKGAKGIFRDDGPLSDCNGGEFGGDDNTRAPACAADAAIDDATIGNGIGGASGSILRNRLCN
jgi:hypothetical protein